MRLDEVLESLPGLLMLRVVPGEQHNAESRPGPAALGRKQAALAGEPGQFQELVAVEDVEDAVSEEVGHGQAGHGLAGVLLEQKQRVHRLGHSKTLQG